MAESRKDIVIRIFAKTKDGARVPVHSEGSMLTTSERQFAEGLLARVESKQHLGRALRNRRQESIKPEPGQKDPFHPD